MDWRNHQMFEQEFRINYSQVSYIHSEVNSDEQKNWVRSPLRLLFGKKHDY